MTPTKTFRIILTLTAEEANAIAKFARTEDRDMRKQARRFLRERLIECNLLPCKPEAQAEDPQPNAS